MAEIEIISDEQLVRRALPALHQLGPVCFCVSCDAHAALSRMVAREREMEEELQSLSYTERFGAE